jgi:hypothetical protein
MRSQVIRTIDRGESRTQGLASRVDNDYRELPSLRLTAAQACRLWRLDPLTCDVVLDALVRDGHLRKTPDGAYVRG